MFSLKRQVKALFFLFCLALLFARSSHAAVRCETQYGGGEKCWETAEIVLDKKVWYQTEESFVDNLADVSPTGFKFALNDRVIYRIKYTNVSNRKFDKVTISDTLPVDKYLKYDTTNIVNPRFEYQNGKIVKISFDVYDFEPGESDEKQIELLVTKVPADLGFDCEVTNVAELWASENYARDTAKICVTSRNKVLGVTTLPKTGFFTLVYALAFCAISAFIGLLLIRLNRKP
jgi:uncharacterized repeat protein (TIGR01451 family)